NQGLTGVRYATLVVTNCFPIAARIEATHASLSPRLTNRRLTTIFLTHQDLRRRAQALLAAKTATIPFARFTVLNADAVLAALIANQSINTTRIFGTKAVQLSYRTAHGHAHPFAASKGVSVFVVATGVLFG